MSVNWYSQRSRPASPRSARRTKGDDDLIITVKDPALVAELLTHLRNCGCIAYLASQGRSVEAIYPDAPEQQERRQILGFVGEWAASHPDAELILGR